MPDCDSRTNEARLVSEARSPNCVGARIPAWVGGFRSRTELYHVVCMSCSVCWWKLDSSNSFGMCLCLRFCFCVSKCSSAGCAQVFLAETLMSMPSRDVSNQFSPGSSIARCTSSCWNEFGSMGTPDSQSFDGPPLSHFSHPPNPCISDSYFAPGQPASPPADSGPICTRPLPWQDRTNL